MGRFIECKQRKLDCLMCKDGKCIALNNTEFINKECPFYKKKDIITNIKNIK